MMISHPLPLVGMGGFEPPKPKAPVLQTGDDLQLISIPINLLVTAVGLEPTEAR